jgi:hypothetical protein
MANYKHTVRYKVPGSANVLEHVIVCPTREEAEEKFATEVPNGMIDIILSTIPSLNG